MVEGYIKTPQPLKFLKFFNNQFGTDIALYEENEVL